MNDRMRNRLPLRPIEVAVCLAVALECLVIDALVVARAPALSLDSLGPIALAYHDKQPRPLGVAAVILVLLLGTLLPRGGRVAALLFVGAAMANFASPAIWRDGIPDYFVLRGPDLILNIPDLLMIVAGLVMALSMGADFVRRAGTFGTPSRA